MGKRVKWFGAVKKVFSPEPKEKKSLDEQKTPKSKKKWFGKQKPTDLDSTCTPTNCNGPSVVPPPSTPVEETKVMEVENEQNKRARSMALATAAAAEAAIVAAHAAAEVVRLTKSAPKYSGKSREEVAAIKIQTVFRGYLARRALRALKGLVRLKSLVHGDSVKRQAASTLRCMQTLARVQVQIRTRRIKMTEGNQALQRQLQLKRDKEALKASMGENWDVSLQSKEQIEASLVSRHEATVKRERALAYAYSHQWKSSSRSVNPTFTDPHNPNWGWSWLERRMASRPWESRSNATEKETNNDHESVKSASRNARGEIVKAYARRDIDMDSVSQVAQKSNQPMNLQSPSTPRSYIMRKAKPASPRGGHDLSEDDARSILSLQSEWNRRHSIAGSSVRDDESLTSSPSIPSYMTPTQSARAKSRFQSLTTEMNETPEKGSGGPVKRRLSFPAMEKKQTLSRAVARRHSGPPKLSASPISVGNGGSR